MRKLKRQNHRKGAILALLVMVMLMVSMTSLALIRVGTDARIRTVKSDLETAARFAADAGIERALYLMNKTLTAGAWTLDDVPTFSVEPFTACDADYTVTFSGNLLSGYQVTSVGHCRNRTKTVRATIALTSPIAKDFAIFSKNNIDFKNGSQVGGFNSNDLGDTDVRAKIGSLSLNDRSINIDKDVTINADVYIPPESDPDRVIETHSGADLNGNILFLPSYYSLPPISAPDYVASQGSISGDAITLNSSDSGKYSDMTISNNGKLSVTGDLTLYITGNIELKNNAEIEIEDNASLTLYLDGNLDGKNASGFNNKTQIPSSLQIYGTGNDQKIDLKNSTDLYAVVYAPHSQMVVHNSVDAYGSFIVEDIELKNSADVYYDKALRQVSVDDALVRFEIIRWEEI